jgi:hypothetical protein
MVLGLVGLTDQAGRGPRAGEDLVREGTHVGEGLMGGDVDGEGHRLTGSRHGLDDACVTRDVHRVEDAQPEPIAHEGGVGRPLDVERHDPIGVTRQHPAPVEGLCVVRTAGVEGDLEGVLAGEHPLARDDPRPRGPVQILEDEVDAPHDLVPTEHDVAQLPVGVHERQGPGAERDTSGRGVGGAVPLDGIQDRLPTEYRVPESADA